MITLSEIKYYLGINSNEKNDYLFSLINQSLKEFETMTNRRYEYNSAITEYIDCNEFSDRVYLYTNPIISIDTIQYYDNAEEEYTDLIDGTGDTIANTVEVYNDFIKIRKGYSFFGKDIKIIYSAGYRFTKSAGTITALLNTTSLTGSSTLFLTEAEANDLIILDEEIKTVSTISTNTALTITTALNRSHANSNVYFTNYPKDIRQAIKEICRYKYLNENKIKLNENEQLQPLSELPYNVTTVIDYYRRVNI